MLLMYHATFYSDRSFETSDSSSWSIAGLALALIHRFWVGVPMFFVISGYCISASVDASRARPYSLWSYFSRRFRRIYPPLWTMCAVTVLLVLSLNAWPEVANNCRQLPKIADLSISNWLGNFAAAETWFHNILGGQPRYLIGNTWTLCYEEQFYVVTGLFLLISSRRFFALSWTVTLIVLLMHHTLDAFAIAHNGFFWDGHWLLFATGILVYHVINHQKPLHRRWSYATLAAGSMYGFIGRIVARDDLHRHLSDYVIISSLFGLALIWLWQWDHRVARHWLLLPFTWCGKRSYSIYLTHYPLVVLISSTAAMIGLTSETSVLTVVLPWSLVLSVPVACLFHETVERRFLNSPVKR